eukprot:TRINITY_DN12784_c0_g1_i1.p1 TRINITY_DN12784_c0_g1~~TRINITY_DN12784_c0_g1_i1.p1  ORF type:complete len:394 (-),score=85.08 TRINITY_DN12784_c0_g1_i1:95-1276(-)
MNTILTKETLTSDEFTSLLQDCFNPTPLSRPQAFLRIVNQNSLAQENFSKDGVQKNVHIVVKNTPFQISVGLTSNMLNGKIIDFNLLTVDASLLFDTNDEKLVPFLKQKPVEYKGKVNDRADTMNLDLKIKVLTSHCENMLFRIKFTCKDPRSGESYPTLTAVSAPIKVISKPDQIRKRKQPESSSTSQDTQDYDDEPETDQPKTRKPPKKRTRVTINDKILEGIARIEEEQKRHHSLLESMAATQATQTQIQSNPLADLDLFGLNSQTDNTNQEHMMLAVHTKPQDPQDAQDLQGAYDKLIDIFMKLPNENKVEEIRKVIRNSSTRKTETFCEMIALFNSEGLQKEMGRDCLLENSSMPLSAGDCGAACPHKRELEKIDDFYSSMMNFSYGS